MRPEITNNNSGKSPYAFSKWSKQQFKHYWCCYHDANDMCKFYAILLKVGMNMIWSISHRGRNERGAMATMMERVPRQRNGNDATATSRWSGSSRGYWCKKEVGVSVTCKMMGCSRIPGSHMLTARQRGTRKEQLGHDATTSISYITCIRSTGDRLDGYTFEACIIGTDPVRRGK